MSSSSLTGHAAVATGASRGIGRAVAVHLARRGADVAGIARPRQELDSLVCELDGTGIKVFCVHPGFVRTPMTEHLAWGEQGQAWLPGFGDRAQQHWGDAEAATALIEAIATGAADDLTGRVLLAGDDLDVLGRECRADPDRRRLRLGLD